MVIDEPRTRLKMVCLKLEQQHGSTGGTVRLSPVTGWGGKENAEFWKYTPSGTFEFNTINEDAYRQFRLGEEYYVEIRQVPVLDRVHAEREYVLAEIEKLRPQVEGKNPDGSWAWQSMNEYQKRLQGLDQRLRELVPQTPTP